MRFIANIPKKGVYRNSCMNVAQVIKIKTKK